MKLARHGQSPRATSRARFAPGASRFSLQVVRPRPDASRSRERGIALIIVMIAVFVLAILAGGFAHSMKVETVLARNSNSEAELEWLGRSGVEYCKWILAQKQCNYDALNQRWAGGPGDPCSTNGPLTEVVNEVHLGRGSFTWKITDLERKWNINTATEDRIGLAFQVMGLDPSEASEVAASITDWIDADDQTHLGGAEKNYYQSLDPPYEAKNGPLDDISELLFIKGITRDIYWGTASSNSMPGRLQQQLSRSGGRIVPDAYPVGLVDLFTPISTGRLNINTASVYTLQLIPGMTSKMAEEIVSAREGEDDASGPAGLTGPYKSLDLRARLGPEITALLANANVTTQSSTFEVQIDATIGSYHRTFIAIVARAPQGLQTLNFYWK